MEINTSMQLFSLLINKSPKLIISKSFLMIPDFLNYLLAGRKCSEYTIATTSQLVDAKTHNWSQILIKKLGLDESLFQEIINPGTILGPIKDAVADEVGLSRATNLIAPACHDSASAIAAVPVDANEYERGEWAYLSSGTWSLLGVELDNPLINKKSLELNITNEGGVENTIRFLKNVTGLWLIQECKKAWENEKPSLTWDTIISKALKAVPFQCFIDPDDPKFLNPPNMIQAIQDFCQETNQYIPVKIGEIARTIFESLAFRYKKVVDNLESILENKIKILFIIGGGSSNRLLNQFTANSLNIPVRAGPIEATAIGNILVQAKALNIEIQLQQLRKIIKKSFTIEDYYPENNEIWKIEYEKYLRYVKKQVNT